MLCCLPSQAHNIEVLVFACRYVSSAFLDIVCGLCAFFGRLAEIQMYLFVHVVCAIRAVWGFFHNHRFLCLCGTIDVILALFFKMYQHVNIT